MLITYLKNIKFTYQPLIIKRLEISLRARWNLMLALAFSAKHCYSSYSEYRLTELLVLNVRVFLPTMSFSIQQLGHLWSSVKYQQRVFLQVLKLIFTSSPQCRNKM